MRRVFTCAGAIGPAAGVTGIAVAVYLNRSWWDPRATSISHLGRYTDPGVSHPEILNLSLIICALLTIVYTSGLLVERRKGGSPLGPLLYTGGLTTLALVGVFPSGTRPHYPASVGFFLLTQAAVLAFAVTWRGKKDYTLLSLMLFITGTLSFYVLLAIYEGDGMGELSWVVTLLIWHYMTLWHMSR